jgi:flagellar biosynthesis protein FlhB
MAATTIIKLAIDTSQGQGLAGGCSNDTAAAVPLDTTWLFDVARLSIPLLVVAAVAGGAAQLAQTGMALAPKRLAPDLARLDAIAGLGALASKLRAFQVARALLLAAIVAWLAQRGLAAHAHELALVTGRLAFAAPLAGTLAGSLARDAAFAGLVLGAVDLAISKRAWWTKLRMSREEIVREHKEAEGDPQTKAARERAHHEMLAAATVASVRDATVVVVNPTHLACALRYDEGKDEAPIVLATGEAELARRIVAEAHHHGVPVVRDVPLARALIELEPGDAIPEALFEAVAELLQEAWAQAGAPEPRSL